MTDWPKEDYGKFYNGDSYIILNTYKDPNNPDSEVPWLICEYNESLGRGAAAERVAKILK